MSKDGVFDSAAERIETLAETARPNTLVSSRPGSAASVLSSLATGTSQVKAAKDQGVSRGVVSRLAGTNREWLAEWRAKELAGVSAQAEQARRITTLKMDELEHDPEARAKVGVKDLAVTQGILLDKADRLAGTPDLTVKVEHEFTLEDAGDWLAKAREAQGAVVELEVKLDSA